MISVINDNAYQSIHWEFKSNRFALCTVTSTTNYTFTGCQNTYLNVVWNSISFYCYAVRIIYRRSSPVVFRQSVFSLTMSVKEREYFRKAFNILKPACDAFITEPSTANGSRLKNVLATVPGCSLEQLQPYVLIPLEIHLQTTKYVWLWLDLFAVFIL